MTTTSLKGLSLKQIDEAVATGATSKADAVTELQSRLARPGFAGFKRIRTERALAMLSGEGRIDLGKAFAKVEAPKAAEPKAKPSKKGKGKTAAETPVEKALKLLGAMPEAQVVAFLNVLSTFK